MTDASRTPSETDQLEMLITFNNLQRQTVLWKLEDLTEEQLRQKHEPSGMSLLGLLKHLIRVEQTWFAARLMGEEIDGDSHTEDAWNPTPEETYEVLTEKYRQAFTRSNKIARSIPLDQSTLQPGSSGSNVTLQWVLFHMLEETARHLGHADFIRESLDGAVGVNPEHEANRTARKKQQEDG